MYINPNPFMAGVGKTLAAAATVQDMAIEETMDFNAGDYPIVCGQNEGFAVRNSILMGAAGTVRWNVTIGWIEALTY